LSSFQQCLEHTIHPPTGSTINESGSVRTSAEDAGQNVKQLLRAALNIPPTVYSLRRVFYMPALEN
jgi:hypothetical protein